MIEVMSPKEINISDEKARAFEQFMKRKRLEAGYSRQQDAASAIGVSQDLISRLESRFTPNVRLGEFSLVLKAYKIVPTDAYEMLGLYDVAGAPEAESEFIRKEILPQLEQFDMQELQYASRLLRAIKRNAQ